MGDNKKVPQSSEPEINDRTMHEIDYLKHHVGPILISALSEICTHRPSDPIEYLGYWLVRYRYNEELKRRDILNTMEAIHLKWQLGEDPSIILEGFTPSHPFPPPGYGGPLDASDFVEEIGEGEGPREPVQPPQEYLGEVEYYENVPEDEAWEELEEPPAPVSEELVDAEEIPEEIPLDQQLEVDGGAGADTELDVPTPDQAQLIEPAGKPQPLAKPQK